MKSKIEIALDNLSIRKAKRIVEKYNSDAEAYKNKIYIDFMAMIGKEWKKDDIRRIYFNQYNMFYDFDTKAMEAINSNEKMDFSAFENKMIKLIDSE